MSHEDFAACVGLDWAAAKHELCVQAAGSGTRAFLVLEHSPEAIDTWVRTLRTRCNGHPVAVCLELKKGPMVAALRNDDFLVLYPVHPFALAQSRDAFTPSRATDDPTDAERQGALLRKHHAKLPPLTPHNPTMRALAHLVAPRRRWVGDTVRLTHRLTSALTNYCPQVLQWLDEQDPARFCDFLSRWPTLNAAQLARRSTLERCCRAHPVRSADVSATRRQAIKRAVALSTDDGIITPTPRLVPALVAQLRVP